MALILKNNILFFHIPKTGGNWVEEVLAKQGLVKARISDKHATYDYVCKQPLSPKIKKMIRQSNARRRYLTKCPRMFCVVRHPVTWYESWFRFQTSLNWRSWGSVGNMGDWHVLSDLNINSDEDFNRFMWNVNRNLPGFVSQLFARYINNSGAVALKNENLALDLTEYLESCDVACDREAILNAKRVNESPRITVQWDQKLLQETLLNERAVLQRFDYEDEKAAS